MKQVGRGGGTCILDMRAVVDVIKSYKYITEL